MSAALPNPPTAGLILAGGLARRMGGGDKPLRMLAGRTVLARVVDRLVPQCATLLINANGDPGRFAAFGCPVVPDDVEDFAGPLAGILAGLDWLSTHRSELQWMVSVAGDSPFIPKDLVERLHAAREAGGKPLAVALSAEQAHPVNALWPVSLREDLRAALRGEGLRKIDRWTARHGVAEARWEAEPVDPFFNANTPEDLAEAERLLAAHDLDRVERG